ncbi:unnamed protein product [Rhizophagus irregularis]|uniref:Uncharacterized protein n=1 Tax=Rhizophagus irregularis TaxID=588596 RepID=A0A2I1GHG5_9GLOM|nr:hypothetical protein RhiirA4_460839 [Rhizophagus irregularis]CAB4407702.1 unnamed protein product [Rhizophagus irregularis]
MAFFQKITKVSKKVLSKKVKYVNELTELCCDEGSRELLDSNPEIFSDEKMCKIILTALKCKSERDPLLIITWNYSTFIEENLSRDKDRSHTLDSLFQHIKDSGGVSIDDKHGVFMFNTGTTLSACLYGFPTWSHRIDGKEDVVHSIIRLNKLVDTNYELERCDYPLKNPSV